MKTPSILFVDDDPNVLQGLKRMLHHKRQDWRLSFANSGAEALAAMAVAPVDVLISDMRMPEIDGAALLSETAKRHPDTIRFILSGQSSKEALLRSVGPCHQFLSKPCEGKVLEARIEAALALRRRLADPKLRAVIGELAVVPSLPRIYSDLQAELETGQPRQDRVEAIVARSPGFAAKMLQIANSAYFQRGRDIHSIWRAINFLGYEIVRTLALSFGITGQLRHRTVGSLPVAWVVERGMLVAALARAIGRAEGLPPETIEDCFSAGVLRDIGFLVLADNFPDRYARVIEAAAQEHVALDLAERAAFGVTHADVGAYLLGTWGLPDSIVQAVSDHHRPLTGAEPIDAAVAVRLANRLVAEGETEPLSGSPAGLEHFAEDRLAAWRALRDAALEGKEP